MCECLNVDVGSYDNQVVLPYPFKESSKDFVSVDKCLKGELLKLWSLGIETTGCCCGHNKKVPYIGVKEEYIPMMLELGYNIYLNNTDLSRLDSFIAKSANVTDVEIYKNYIEEVCNGNNAVLDRANR